MWHINNGRCYHLLVLNSLTNYFQVQLISNILQALKILNNYITLAHLVLPLMRPQLDDLHTNGTYIQIGQGIPSILGSFALLNICLNGGDDSKVDDLKDIIHIS